MSTDKKEELISDVKRYFDLQYEITRLELAGKISRSGSSFVTSLILCGVALVSLFFASTAIALYLSKISGSYIQGFLLVGIFYLMVLFFLFIFRKRLLSKPLDDRM